MKIVPKNNSEKHDPRFVIVNDNNKVIDDANGYGYRSISKAKKGMWYKFEGGREKINKDRNKRRAFFKKHEGLEDYLMSMWECNVKELYRGEVTEEDIINAVEEKFGIQLPRGYERGID